MKTLSFFLIVLSVHALNAGSLPAGYFQQEVKYDIDVKLDDQDHILRGHERLVYINNSPSSLNFIWMHLWPNAYKNNETAFARQMWENGSSRFYFSPDDEKGYIDSLNFTVNGKSLTVESHPDWIDVVKLVLPEPLGPGRRITIETPFKVKLPKVFSRLGHTGKHYEITQWYPKPAVYDLAGWHPMPYLNMGEFYSEFGSFDVKITIPEKYVVMATGSMVDGEAEYAWLDSLADEGNKLKLMSKPKVKKYAKSLKKKIKKRNKLEKQNKAKPNFKTLHFHQDRVHDFAWFADRDYIVQKGTLELPYSSREVTLWSGFLPKNAELWKYSTEYLHDSGYWYSKFYGDYPYEHITAVDGDLSAGGGMEYPNITIISKMPSKDVLEMVIMHEVGHNWFYGILGSNERDHAWMDEGLNEFTNIWYWEKKYGLNGRMKVFPDKVHKFILRDASFRWLGAYTGYQSRTMQKDGQPIELLSTEFYPSNYGSMIYSKTAIFTFYLKHYLGEEKFQDVMMDYYETFKFKHPQPEDFQAIFAANLKDDLGWYFDDVFHTTKGVDYAIREESEQKVTISNSGDLASPVELVYYDEGGQETTREWMNGFTGSKTITLPHNSSYVSIDPEDYMPDYNKANNFSEQEGIKINAIIDEPDYQKNYLGNLTPWGLVNSYNKAIGFNLRRGNMPLENWQYKITPLWDFDNHTMVGGATLTHSRYRTTMFDKISASAEIHKSQGRTTAAGGLDLIYRKPVISEPYIKLHLKAYYHNFQKLSEFDPAVWDVMDNIVSIVGKIQYYNKYSPILKSNSYLQIRYAANNHTHSSILAYSSAEYQPLKKLQIHGEFSFLTAPDNEIAQYSPRIGGSVDPDFENYIWNRSGTGSLKMIGEQVLPEESGMRIAPDPFLTYDTGYKFAITLSNFIPHTSVFLDYLHINEEYLFNGKSYQNFAALGFSVDAGPVLIHVPLLMNWDTDVKPGSGDWEDYIRFEITFNPNNIRIGM